MFLTEEQYLALPIAERLVPMTRTVAKMFAIEGASLVSVDTVDFGLMERALVVIALRIDAEAENDRDDYETAVALGVLADVVEQGITLEQARARALAVGAQFPIELTF